MRHRLRKLAKFIWDNDLTFVVSISLLLSIMSFITSIYKMDFSLNAILEIVVPLIIITILCLTNLKIQKQNKIRKDTNMEDTNLDG